MLCLRPGALGWADSSGQLCSVITLAFESIALHNGIGTHKMFLTDAKAVEASKWSNITITPSLLACMLARISLCLLMLRIVGRTLAYQVFLWFIIVGTVVFSSLAVSNTYIACVPVAKVWDPALPGTCNRDRRLAIGTALSGWTIGADWLVALFPIVMLRRLQMATKTKIALGIIMSLGFL